MPNTVELDDWKSFVDNNPFAYTYERYRKATIAAKQSFEATKEFKKRFPKLSHLLGQSRSYIMDTDKGQRILFAWTDKNNAAFGWLCYPQKVAGAMKLDLHPDHLLLLSCFGGIDEYWNDPPSPINNLHGALGLRDTKKGLGPTKEVFGNELPKNLNPDDYVTFAMEGNGDLLVYHSRTGEVRTLRFEHSGFFDDFFQLSDSVPDLQSWIERLAERYLLNIRSK